MIDIKKFLKGLRILNSADQTKSSELAVSDTATTNTKLTVVAKQNKNTTLEFPNTPIGVTTDELSSIQAEQTLKNKNLDDATTAVVDSSDPTKKITFDAAGSTATTTTVRATQTANRIVDLPDASDTLVGKNTTDTLTNKTLTSPIINTPDINNGTIDGAAIATSTVNSTPIGATTPSTGSFTTLTATSLDVSGDTVVTQNATQTLSNKSLQDTTTFIVDSVDATKKIAFDAAGSTATTTTLLSSQTANRTLTLPDATDTLVGKNTTDTLTNKTLTSPTINTPVVSGGTINSAIIGNVTPAAVTATTLTSTGDAIIQGNLTVNGTTTTINSTNLEVTDKNILINNGGNDASSEGAGLTVSRTGTSGSFIFKDASPSKFAAGSLAAEDNLVTQTVTQTLTNKALQDTTTSIVDSVDATKRILFDAAGATGTATTLVSTQNANRSIFLPDASTNLIGEDTINTLTGKTLQFLKQSVATDSSTTGTAATIGTVTTGILRLTNASLVSLAGIVGLQSGQSLIIENKTGVNISLLNNNAGAIAQNRILTGTNADITLNNDASISFHYDATTLKWMVVGGTGSSASSGEVNYVTNGTGEAGTVGWLGYDDGSATRPVDGTGGTATGLTLATTAVNPLHGTLSLTLAKDAADRRGKGYSYDFTIDEGDKGKVLQIKAEQIISSGTFVAGTSTTDSDVIVYIYDVTNARLIEPSNIKFFSNSTTVSENMRAEFQTASNSTSYRLIFHVATTSASAWTMKFEASVSPSKYVYGTPVTDSISYTPTLGAGFGAATNISFRYYRIGERVFIRGSFTSGTHAPALGSISLPTGLTLDTTKTSINNTTASPGSYAGDWVASGNGAYLGHIVTAPATSTTLVYIGTPSTVSGLNTPIASVSGNIGISNIVFDIDFSVPITGFSSSVQMSDIADSRLVSFVGTKTANQSVTGGTTDVSYTTIKDSHGAWTGSTYVIPVAGDYQISATANTTGGGSFEVYINGTRRKRLFDISATEVRTGATNVNDLKVGDTISLRNSATTTVSGDGAQDYNININRISGPSAIAATETVAARYFVSAGASTASTSPINYDTKSFDTHSAVTTGVGVWKFTAPSSGLYQISVIGYAGSTLFRHRLYKNGILYSVLGDSIANTSPGGGTDSIRLIAGDYIDVRPVSTVTPQSEGSGIGESNHININRIGL